MMFSVQAGLFEFLIGCIRSDGKYHYADPNKTSSHQNITLQAASGDCALAAYDGQQWSRP